MLTLSNLRLAPAPEIPLYIYLPNLMKPSPDSLPGSILTPPGSQRPTQQA